MKVPHRDREREGLLDAHSIAASADVDYFGKRSFFFVPSFLLSYFRLSKQSSVLCESPVSQNDWRKNVKMCESCKIVKEVFCFLLYLNDEWKCCWWRCSEEKNWQQQQLQQQQQQHNNFKCQVSMCWRSPKMDSLWATMLLPPGILLKDELVIH